MNADDLAKIRAAHGDTVECNCPRCQQLYSLCEELTAAWAENNRLGDFSLDQEGKARAAEAELAAALLDSDDLRNHLEVTEADITAVRAAAARMTSMDLLCRLPPDHPVHRCCAAAEADIAAAQAAIGRAEALVGDLIGYCDWHQGTPSSRFRESNVRALAHKIRASLAGEAP